MFSVADQIDAVIGGDTHSQFHQLELAAASGAVLATTRVSNDPAGFRSAVAWISEHAPGPRLIVGLEGTRSYGVGLARALTAAGFTVVEVEQPTRKDRRGRGKSDPIDAHHAVRSVLGMDPAKLPSPRSDGDREALRILLAGYQEIIETGVRQLNALRALLLTGDDRDRATAGHSASFDWFASLARRRARADETCEQAVRRSEVRRLALACHQARRDRNDYKKRIEELAETLAPGITVQRGIGPVSAAQLLIGFSHPGRFRNEAAFANFTGTAPLEASSGNTIRHRLSRGGDRQLNRALHAIAMTRTRCCPETREYVARRTAEGKTPREIRRCLKRYIARQQYRYMTAVMLDNT